MSADPFTMRNQVKVNNEDLESFLRDMSHWEDDVKRRDQQLKTKSKGATSERREDEGKIIQESPPSKLKNPTKQTAATEQFSSIVSQNKQQAIWEKDKGNDYFKANQWQEAIECYSKAINLDPACAIFPANRAMARLKLKQFEGAEEDCDTALSLDPSYLKAYHRRAMARAQLNKLELAKQDYERVLQMEPANKLAQAELQRVLQKIFTAPKAEKKKTVTFQAPSTKKQSLPTLYKELETLEPVSEPKQGVRQKIPLQTVQGDAKSGQFMERFLSSLSSPPQPPQALQPSSPVTLTQKTVLESSQVDLPAVPNTYVQFLMDWRRIRSDLQLRYLYLEKIPGEKIPAIFQQAMEAQNLTDIMETLPLFVANQDAVFPLMKGLSQVKRLQALLLFLSPKETQILRDVFKYMAETNDGSAAERETLCRYFNIFV